MLTKLLKALTRSRASPNATDTHADANHQGDDDGDKPAASGNSDTQARPWADVSRNEQRQSRHATRMARVKHRELNQLREARKLELEARKKEEGTARWQLSTAPLVLDGKNQLIRKIDEIESVMNLRDMPPPQARRDTSSARSAAVSAADAELDPHSFTLFDAAAILVTTGRAAAEAALRKIIAAHAHADTDESQPGDEAWECLMELLRAAGERPAFIAAAQEYERSNNRPATVRFQHAPARSADGVTLPTEGHWLCPTRLGSISMRHLQGLLREGNTTVLNWSRCQGVEAGASHVLLELLRSVADDGAATMQEGQALATALSKQAAPLRADPIWWLCLMEALRCLDDHARYEIVAMQYCSRYEVSPPSWRAPRARVGQIAQGQQHSSMALSGELVEMSVGSFDRLTSANGDRTSIVLICNNLVRLDFYSAAALVNWAAQRRSHGEHVRLVGVHMLLGLYLASIGLYDNHASGAGDTMAASEYPASQGTVC